MGDHDGGLAQLVGLLRQQPGNVLSAAGVEGGGGLVEEDQLKRDAPWLTDRQRVSINEWSAYGEAKIAQGLISVGVPEDEASRQAAATIIGVALGGTAGAAAAGIPAAVVGGGAVAAPRDRRSDVCGAWWGTMCVCCISINARSHSCLLVSRTKPNTRRPPCAADDDSRTTRAECTRNGAGLVGHAHSEPATFSMRTYMRRMGWSCGQQGGCAKCQTRSSSVTCSSRPPTNTL